MKPSKRAVSPRNSVAAQCALLCLVLFAPGARAQCDDIHLSHQPAAAAAAGEALSIAGVASGLDEGHGIAIHHRVIGEGDFEVLDAWLRGGRFDAEIPASRVAPPGVEYYLAAAAPDGEPCTHPEGAPVDQLFVVRVDSTGEGESTGAGSPPVVTLIAPDAGLPVEPGELVLVLGFLDPDGDLDPAGVTLRVNGRDRSDEATIRPEVLTWVPGPEFGAGGLEIVCEARDLAGNRARLATTVALSPGGAAGIVDMRDDERIPRPHGRFSASSRFTDLQGAGAVNRQEPARVLDGRLDARGRVGFLGYRARVFLTSDDKPEVQPRSRFRLDLVAGPVTARIGDVNPRFNPLTIWGRRVRGATLRLDTRPFQAQLVSGATARAVEGAGHDSLDVTAPGGVRTIVDQAGTYTRDLLGVRMGFGSDRVMGIGLEALKVKDRLSSITYGLRPKDNVLGGDLRIRLFGRRLRLDTAAAMSLLTDDISSGVLTKEEADSTFGISLPFDPEAFEKILVINSSTTPMNLSGLPNLAVQSSLHADVATHRLEFRYRRIGASYRSLATTTLPVDRRGFRLRDAFTLPDRGLRFSAEFETYRDNLADEKTHTLATRVYAADVGYRPRGGGALTHVNSGLRLYDQDNGDDSEGEGVGNRTLYFSLGGGLRFPLGRLAQTLNLNAHVSRRRDDIAETGETSGLNLFVESRTAFPELPLAFGLLAGRTTHRYPGLTGPEGDDGLDANFTTVQASASYLSPKVPAILTWRLVNGDGNMTGAHSSRSTIDLAVDYRFDAGVGIVARLGHARFDDASETDLDYDEAYFRLGLEQRF